MRTQPLLTRRLWLLLCLLALLVFSPAAAMAQDAPTQVTAEEQALPTIEEVTSQLDDLYRSKSSHSKMSMSITTKRWSRTMEMESWTIGEKKSVVVIRAPAREAGTATLRTDEGLWNYAPRADRLIRVPSAMLSDGWMGSHITNDDLMRETSWDDDYDTKLAWVEEDGVRLLQATMVPKPGAPVVYTKVVQYMSADGWLPVRAEFFGARKRVRTMRYSEVKEMSGRRLPTVFEVIPDDKPNESTRIEYLDLELDVKVDKKLFSARGLRRLAQRR